MSFVVRKRTKMMKDGQSIGVMRKRFGRVDLEFASKAYARIAEITGHKSEELEPRTRRSLAPSPNGAPAWYDQKTHTVHINEDAVRRAHLNFNNNGVSIAPSELSADIYNQTRLFGISTLFNGTLLPTTMDEEMQMTSGQSGSEKYEKLVDIHLRVESLSSAFGNLEVVCDTLAELAQRHGPKLSGKKRETIKFYEGAAYLAIFIGGMAQLTKYGMNAVKAAVIVACAAIATRMWSKISQSILVFRKNTKLFNDAIASVLTVKEIVRKHGVDGYIYVAMTPEIDLRNLGYALYQMKNSNLLYSEGGFNEAGILHVKSMRQTIDEHLAKAEAERASERV